MSRSLYLRSSWQCVLALGLAFGPNLAYAQDDMSVEQIRRELREAAATAAAQKIETVDSSDKPSFAFSETDIQSSNQDLVAAEAELLKKLEGQQNAKDLSAQPTGTDTTSAATDLVKAPSLETETKVISINAGQATTNQQATTVISANPEVTRAALKLPETKNIEAPALAAEIKANADDVAAQIKEPKISKYAKSEEPKEQVLRQQIQEIASLRKTNADLIKRTDRAETKVSTLQKQLSEAQNRLMLAETEVERLSNVLESRNRVATSKISGTQQQAAATGSTARASNSGTTRSTPSDMPVVTVIADKANLRTGPGADNSPLMAVSKGSRLVVEKREGEWYRVVTPSGTRAWISSEVVAFGPDANSGPRGSIRIKGYDASLESSPFASSATPQ